MSSIRIGEVDECRLYVKDASFMLPSAELKSKAELEREPHGGLASGSPSYVDDFYKQIEIINWDGDIIRIEASALYELLLSIGKETKTKINMRKTVERLKKIIHKNY